MQYYAAFYLSSLLDIKHRLGVSRIQRINIHYCVKTVSHAINSDVLTGKTPYINQAIHVLLMHGFCTLHIRILGRHKK